MSFVILNIFGIPVGMLPVSLIFAAVLFSAVKSVVFIVVCYYLALSPALSYRYLYSFDKNELEWYDRFDGVITRELLSEMNVENNTLSAELEQKIEVLEKYLLGGGSVFTTYYTDLSKSIYDLTRKINALERITETTESGLNYSEDSGRTIWLIKPYSYELLFVNDKKTVQRNNLYILLGIIGALAGIMSYYAKAECCL